MRGGADQHLRAVLVDQAQRHRLTLAVGRVERGVQAPEGVVLVQVPGLAPAQAEARGLEGLPQLLQAHDVHHLHNVMNPVAMERALQGGRGVVTVQDHRAFCPGPGKTLPDGGACHQAMGEKTCAACLPDPAYAARLLELTQARLEALGMARERVVLSHYMARELRALGLSAQVIPPWLACAGPKQEPGWGFVLGGRLVRHKDPLLAWSAWTRAGRPQPLRLAGLGPLETELEGAQALGWLDQDPLHALLRQSRALLFPARWQEPFGILGAQALAQGTPVIACERGGVADWAREGALLLPPGDVKGITQAITQLHADPEGARALGARGQAWVRELLQQERLSAALDAVYAGLA